MPKWLYRIDSWGYGLRMICLYFILKDESDSFNSLRRILLLSSCKQFVKMLLPIFQLFDRLKLPGVDFLFKLPSKCAICPVFYTFLETIWKNGKALTSVSQSFKVTDHLIIKWFEKLHTWLQIKI